jgi:hypothetical protein
MINEASDLADLLAGGPLASRPVYVIELPRSGERVLTAPVRADVLLEEWSAARALVPQTGRWPVAAMSWTREKMPPTLKTFWLDPRGERPVPPSICAAARELEGSSVIEEIWAAQPWWEWMDRERVEWQLESTRKRCGEAPERDDVLTALRDLQREHFRWSGQDGSPSETDLEHWLFRWEERKRPTPAPELVDHDDWFVPPKEDETHLLVLPTKHGPEALAYLNFYAIEDGVAGVTAERLIAILAYWEARYGAQLVANWGTMLQFVVRRPPDTLEEAWDLAIDLDLIGPSGKAWVHVRDGARYLWRRPTWFVHCRP